MAKNPCSDFSKTIYDLARQYSADENVGDIDTLLTKIQEQQPDLTREQLVGAIADASTARAIDLTAAQKRLAQIKREARTDIRLRKAIEDLETHVKDSTLPAAQRKVSNTPQAIRELQAKKAELKAAISQSEPALKQRLERQITDLTDRLSRNEFAEAIPEESVTSSKEVARLEFERDKLRKEINTKIRDAQPKTIWGTVAEASQFFKGVKASMDLPPLFRQGLFALTNPQRAAAAFVDGIKAMGSQKAEYESQQEIENRDNFPLYQKMGLRLRSPEAGLTESDENFRSKVFSNASKGFKRVPGSKIVGNVVEVAYKGSGRGYVTFLNRLRADMFDAWSQAWTANGIPTEIEGRRIAYLVNVLTGEGSLGKLEGISPQLNAVFFSPRNIASRLQMVIAPFESVAGEIAHVAARGKKVKIPGTSVTIDTGNIAGGKKIRRAVLKEYAKFISGVAGMYAMAGIAFDDDDDFEIMSDPTHTMAGALRFGSSYLDPLGGLRPLLVLTSRIATGEKTTASGKKVDIRGPEKAYATDSPAALITKYFQGKMAPAPGELLEWLNGSDFKGDPVTFWQTVGDLIIPMSPQDVVGAYREHGLVGGSAISALITTGMGAQNYQTRGGTKGKSKRNVLVQ